MQSITLTVVTDVHLSEAQAGAAARDWAKRAGVHLIIWSTHDDEPWLSVVGALDDDTPENPARVNEVVQDIADYFDAFVDALEAVGAKVAAWRGVEILSGKERNRRATARTDLPETVDAVEFAELTSLTRQRIQQYESDRRAGKRRSFPAQVLPGRWLRADAELWAATRRTRPGPPRTAS